MIQQLNNYIIRHNIQAYSIAQIQNGQELTIKLRQANPANNCYSISKNFTATAIGILMRQNKLSLDSPILDFFPEYRTRCDVKFQNVTIRHLLSHTTGYATGFLFEADRYTHGTDNWLDICFFQFPLIYNPGEKMVYNNAGYYLLSVIVERISQMGLDDFLVTHLLNALHAEGTAFSKCPQMHVVGATGLIARTIDVARLGQLYLQHGAFENRQILDESFVEEATRTVYTDGYRQYGLSFWRNRNELSYYGDGAHGQLLLVYPKTQTVLAMHGYDAFSMPNLVDALIQYS